MNTIKQGDTSPVLEQTLTDSNGTPENLTGYISIKFIMRDKHTLETIINDDTSGNLSVVDAESGIVKYEWDTDDTTRSGTYEAEWQVQFADGSIGTYPNSGYINIEIVSDIDD